MPPLPAHVQLILLLWLIAWNIWGVAVFHDVYRSCYSWQWRVFLITVGGPCIWAVMMWRGLLTARRRILHHYGVGNCGCHHH